MDVFPQGQLVAVDKVTGLIVGRYSGLIIDSDHCGATQDWSSFTGAATYANHNPISGATLFAANVMVLPTSKATASASGSTNADARES